jgi:hypothetical protein
MEVIIESKTRDASGLYLSATCAGVSASVLVSTSGDVRVIVKNALNRAWRGSGPFFSSIAAAINHYRTPAIRAMLQVAAS